MCFVHSSCASTLLHYFCFQFHGRYAMYGVVDGCGVVDMRRSDWWSEARSATPYSVQNSVLHQQCWNYEYYPFTELLTVILIKVQQIPAHQSNAVRITRDGLSGLMGQSGEARRSTSPTGRESYATQGGNRQAARDADEDGSWPGVHPCSGRTQGGCSLQSKAA